jgi:serine/threonine-protein kinase
MSDEPKDGMWSRIKGWFRGAPERLPPAPQSHKEPAMLRPEEELWLEDLIAAVADGRRLDDIATEPFWERITALWERGHERLATEWLDKFIIAPAAPAEAVVALRLRLVELLERRRNLGAAVPHLEALTRIHEHAVRANYLLAEHYRRRGEEARALRHYEAVLARDVDYPNVRIRVERLRAARGYEAPVAGGETIASPEGAGVKAGARYRLIRELGRGATGVVYMARDAELERDVAVKLLHPHLAASHRARACARFFGEARVAASLRHPNIVAILDVDEKARRIVMELAGGGTLRQVLRERGPRNIRRALERHAQILSALEAAHRRGIVHRDLKPGNLMFRRDPDEPGAEIMLGDFGVAHLPDEKGETGAAAAEDKKPSEAVGTLAYMAPEQRSGEATPSSDVYGAAVVLFEMLTARVPWARDVLLAGSRSEDDFQLPGEVTAGLQPQLAAQLQAHLRRIGHPDPEQRPSTAEALIEARNLRDFAIAEAS